MGLHSGNLTIKSGTARPMRKTKFIATFDGTPAAKEPALSTINQIKAAIKPPRFAICAAAIFGCAEMGRVRMANEGSKFSV